VIEVRWLVLLALAACTPAAVSPPRTAAPTGVGQLERPAGMPIGTRGNLDEGAAALPPPEVTDNTDLTIPAFQAASGVPQGATVPCSGCVELNVDVDDINQRDEFVFDAGGVRVTRVVWTILVNFNSDQLAVQPLVDDKRGKYTSLHVNSFPLGKPVEVEQEFKGKAHSIGLIVGSSGAWTGNQTMRVFVDSVRVEGPAGFTRSFDSTDEGLAPRTQAHRPKLVLHPVLTPAAPPDGSEQQVR
jgi:hypothetical protein